MCFMKAWLLYHWNKYCAYLLAPVFFHASRDGYVMNAYFTITEMADAYGVFVLLFVFIVTLVYYRNTLFRVFLFATSVNTKPNGEVIKKRAQLKDWVINKTKHLVTTTNSYRNLRRVISPVFKNITTRFKK